MWDGLLDRWSLWHALFGALASDFRVSIWQTLAVAFAWEWFEWSGAAEALGFAVFHIGPDSGGLANSLMDVGLALAVWVVARAYRRFLLRFRNAPVHG